MEETTQTPPIPSDVEFQGHPVDPDSIEEKQRFLRELERVRAFVEAIDNEILHDEQGAIPDYPPPRYDENRGELPFTPEEVRLRSEIFRRSMAAINAKYQDLPGSDEEFMRGIDSHRPEGSKLFEGYY